MRFLAQPHSSVNLGHGGTGAAGSSVVVLRWEEDQGLEEFRLFGPEKESLDNIFRQIKEGLPKEGGRRCSVPFSTTERQKERGKRPEKDSGELLGESVSCMGGEGLKGVGGITVIRGF